MGHLFAIAESNGESGVSRRAAERRRVMLSAILQTPAERIAVRVRDISQTGALLVSPVQPAVGSNVAFVRGAISVAANVVRVEGSNVALRFREAIDTTALLIAIGKKLEASPKPLTPLFPEGGDAAAYHPAPMQNKAPTLRQVFP